MFFKIRSAKNAACFLAFVALVFSLLLLATAHAQVAGASLSGMVTDPSGASIPQAQVVITKVYTGVARNVTTDSAGFYTAPNLLPGTNEVLTTATGFSTQVRHNAVGGGSADASYHDAGWAGQSNG
jgi:hypothetical protein